MHRKYISYYILFFIALFSATYALGASNLRLDHLNPYLEDWKIVDEGTNYTPSAWLSDNSVITQKSNIFGGKNNREPEKPGTMAISGNPDWCDYIIKAQVNSADDDGIGLVFNYQDTQNYYRFSMDRQRKFRRLIKKINGVVIILAEDRAAYTMKEWHAIKISSINSEIEVFLNNKSIFKVTDDALKKGRIGLYCWGNTNASFKDIVVAAIKKQLPVTIKKVVHSPIIEPVTETKKHPEPAMESGKVAALKDLTPLLLEIEKLRNEVKSLREEVEIRRRLQITEAEKIREEEEILSATGRDYTLLKAGTIGFEYSFNYSYYDYSALLDDIEDRQNNGASGSGDGEPDELPDPVILKQFGNHVLDHGLYLEYAHRDNVTLNVNVPFSFRYENEDTGNSKSISDIGDISVGFQFQPIKVGGRAPAVTFSSNISCPTGRSAYEINRDIDLSTGNGYYSLSTNISLSKSIDPLIAFGGLSYSYTFSENNLDLKLGTIPFHKVSPGDILTLNIGFATALSYNVSLNMGYQYSYQMESHYYLDDSSNTVWEISPSVSAVFSVGTGWRYSPKRTINSRISIGLTRNDPNVTLAFMVPFEFSLN